MFKFIEDTMNSALNVASDTIDYASGGNGPKRKDVVNLASAGVSIALIAAAMGVGVNVIEDMLDD